MYFLILIKSACEEGDLIQWCLEAHESELTVETILTEEIKFKKVIKQLIKVTAVILLLFN